MFVPDLRLLIQQQPIEPKVTYGFGEMCKIDRLDDITVYAQLVTLQKIPFLTRGSEDYHGDKFCAGIGLDSGEEFQPIHFGQFQIHEDQLGNIPGKVRRFCQISTDEVMGSLPEDPDNYFTEESPFKPNSPYAASKAALTAELVVTLQRYS